MKPAMLRAILLVTLAAPMLPAAPQDGGTPRMTVKVRFEPKTAKPGDTVTLLIDGEVEPGYHVYGALEGIGIVPSLEIGKAAAAVLKTKGGFDVPPGELHVNQALPDLKSFWIRGSAQFKQTFVVEKDAPNGELAFTGGFVYMACTEEFCDPPYTQKITAKLIVTGGADRKSSALLAKLPANTPATNTPATKAQDKLSPEHVGAKQVMRIKLVPATARAGEVVTVEIRTSMSPGWHNYGSAQDPELGEPVSMKVTQKDFEILGDAEIPPGEKKEIQFVGTCHYLVGDWVMRQKVRIHAGAKPGEIQVAVDLRYTACDENVCLDPVDTRVGTQLVIEAGPVRPEYAKGPDQATGPPKSNGDGGPAGKADPQGKNGKAPVQIEGSEFQGEREDANAIGLWLYLLGAVGAGLFALIMPCTYPMIPLTVSFFTKQAEVKGGRPIFLALAYGGGIIASYLVLGGLLGDYMQPLATNPWLNLLFGLAFVFFAMSLFGMVELKPPQFLMNSATKAQGMAASSKSGIGAVFPVFLMGVTLCITSFACTAPFLGSMLAAGAAGGQGRLLLGMGVFGATMALPFVVLSLVPGRLPRSGAWMNTAKVLFGFVELAAALKFFSNAEFAWDLLILPREVFLVIWSVLFAVAGIYLLGMIKMKGETGEIGGGQLVTGTVVLILAGYFALGAAGQRFDNIVMTAFEPPYTGRQADSGPEARAKTHTIIEDDFDKAVKVATTAHKLLLVNFTGKL